MQKITHYIKKILNKFILYILLLLLFLVLAIVLSKYNKNKDPYMQKIEEERKLINDINNTSDDNAFPAVDINIDTAGEEIKEYTNKNFLQFVFDNNENKNITFKIFVPKGSEVAIGKTKSEDPFKLTNDSTVTLIEIKNEKIGMFGSIQVVNFTLELNPSNVNLFMLQDILKLKAIKGIGGERVDGIWSDLLAINLENGQVTRIKTIRDSSLYYIIFLTFKDFYEYMKYAKDVSIVFNSFNLTNRLKGISPMKFELLRANGFEVIYPKGWKTETEQSKSKKFMQFYTNSADDESIFMVKMYTSLDKTNRETMDKYLASLKDKSSITFDEIDYDSEFCNEKLGVCAVKLLNAKDSKGKPMDVYIKILSKDDKKIVGVLLTGRLETNNFLIYKEAERVFDIMINSVQVSFFENTKIEDSNWKYLIEKQH